MSAPAALLLLAAAGAALVAGDLPEAERLRRLAPGFTPPPGAALALDARDLRDFGRDKRRDPASLRGTVLVSPPPGSCFTIARGPDAEDIQVCKRSALSFVLGDLDRAGRLHWRVTTGPGDFGTDLAWRSPYRVAIVTPFTSRHEDPPEYRYIASCTAQSDGAGRRVTLGLFGGDTWVIRFPAVDELVPQPDAIPNLAVITSGGKTSLADAQKEKDIESGAKNGENSNEGAPAAPAVEKPKREARNQREDRKDWAIPARNAFGMGASAFQPNGGVTPGMSGECRYIYQGPQDDADTGRVECHNTDGYSEVYLPLTCLGALRQP